MTVDDGTSVLNGLLTTDQGDGRFLYQYRIGTILANHNIYFASTPVSYVIDFDSGGGDGYMNPIPAVYDTAKQLPSCTFTKPGCTFAGWVLEGTSSPIYRDMESVKNLTPIENKRVKLVAQWAVPTCTVTFMNDHTNSVISVMSVNKGSTAMAPSYPTYTGYTATGWDKTPGNVTGDETFTMSYRANTYTVRFDKNNQAATGSMSDQQMTYGTAKKLNRNAFSCTGRTWIGWTTKSDGSGKSYKDEESVSNLTEVDGGTVTLYAQWSTNAYTVRFIDGHDSTVIKTQQVDYGKSATAPDKPVHKGYTASEWNGNYSNITKNTDITVNYSPNRYKIKFDSNGGASGSMSDVEAGYDAKKNLPVNGRDGMITPLERERRIRTVSR